MIHEKPSKQLLLDLLKKGGKYSPPEIGRMCNIQDNTAIKDIKFLRDDGHEIEKEKRKSQEGVEYFVYFLVKEKPKTTGRVFGSCPNPKCRISEFFSSPIHKSGNVKCNCGEVYPATKQP